MEWKGKSQILLNEYFDNKQLLAEKKNETKSFV